MPEVCGAFDLGPTVPRGAVAIQSDPAWLDAWADALVAAAALPDSVDPAAASGQQA